MIDTIYQRIERPNDLPPSGNPNVRSREKHDLEFKSFADPKQPCEHAKDVAAFANVLGGVILVGADDTSGPLLYPGLKKQSVADVKRIYEEAAKMCSPPTVVDVVPVEHPSGVQVVAVNVDPYIEQVVGAPVSVLDKNRRAHKHPNAWVFPIRRASQTSFIEPENLPMYMNREIRRAVLLLAGIPPEARREVLVHYHVQREIEGRHWDGVVQLAKMTLTLGDVSVERNRVRLGRIGSIEVWSAVPLLDVVDVWEPFDGAWEMKIAGRLRWVKGGQFDRLRYEPLPR
jgi:hypothetical protein